MITPPRQSFLGVEFALIDAEEALAWVERAVTSDAFSYLVTPNVDHIVMLHDDGVEPWRIAYREAVSAADLRINDSRILQRLARASGKALPVTPGSDLVRELVQERAGKEGTIALIGGRSAEAAWLRTALPRHRIVHHEPPMGVRDSEAAQQAIAAFVEGTVADICLFAIGAPQSEIVCHRIQQRGRARGVALCIGASVEFLSGAKSRAPAWMQAAGFEWFYRLASEPQRLWRRYLLRGPRIFRLWWSLEKGR